MKRARLPILLMTLLVLLASGLSADEIVLKDGRRFTGEIVRETDESVSIKTVGGTLDFRKAQVARVIWRTEPAKLYEQKRRALSNKSTTARLELARWCIAQDLNEEARRELEQVLLLEAQNVDARVLLARLAKTTGTRIPLRVEVRLTDGSHVKGKLINPLFTLETPYGVLHIPTRTVSSVTIGDDGAPDTIETKKFKTKGRLAEELFVVDSKLGRLTIAKKDVRELAIYQPTAEELAEIEFNNIMREYNHFGLDVVLVVDSTDSMIGVLLRLRQQSNRLCETVRKFVPNAHFGLVSYRDHKKYDPGEFAYVTRLYPLTSKPEEFNQAVGEVRAAGGGDIPEAVFEGLSEAMTRAGWRPRSHRVIILIGDAPPHPQNNGVAKTLQLVGDWHKNTQGVIHVIDTTGYNRMMPEFGSIAEAGGGSATVLNDEQHIGRVLLPLILGEKWKDRLLKAFDAESRPDDVGEAGEHANPDAGVPGP